MGLVFTIVAVYLMRRSLSPRKRTRPGKPQRRGNCTLAMGSLVVPFWGLPYRVLNINQKKELLKSLWISSASTGSFVHVNGAAPEANPSLLSWLGCRLARSLDAERSTRARLPCCPGRWIPRDLVNL